MNRQPGFRSLAAAGDLGILLGSEDGAVRLWNPAAATGGGAGLRTLHAELSDGSAVTAMAFHREPALMAAGTAAGNVVVIGLGLPRRGGTIAVGSPVAHLAFGPDGALAIGDSAGQVTIASMPRRGARVKHAVRVAEDGPAAVGWLDDERLVAGAGAAVTVRSRDGATLGELRGHAGAVAAVSVGARDGCPVVATGSRDCTVRVWDVAPGGDPSVVLGHPGPIEFVAIAPGADLLLAGGAGGHALVWPLTATGPATPLVEQGATVAAAGWWRGRPATATLDGSCVVWDARTGRPLRRLEL